MSPFLADSIAVDNPVKPPPITHKSHEYSSLSVDDEVIDGVREVTANGMGFMLTKSKVFEFIHKPFDNLNDDQWEDFGFASKARQAGFKVHIDGSVIVGHEKKIIL